ncbi:MAG: ribosomal protein S18-alanine N-acetyltransferase [Firmicutes bacterium]|nr:ribosomal protein S18-alanine N-acetyltransferase [Bacillota bacterium]
MLDDLTIRISDGSKEDIDRIALLEQECFPVPWSWDSIAREITNNEASRFFIAEYGGQFAGCVSCWLLPPYECQLGNVAVSPAFRRRGIATALLQRLISDAEAMGILDITLEVRASNTAAIALYQGLGFEQEGLRKGYYQGKEDAIIMWRREKLTVKPEHM